MVEMGEVTVVGRRGLPQDVFFSGHIFFAAPSPLSLLLFRFVDVSISSMDLFFFLVFLGDGAGVAGVLGVAGFFWVVSFFGVAVIVAGAAVAVIVADAASDPVVVVTAAAAAAACVGALVCFWGGDVIGLFSPCLGDPLLFLVTSVQPSWLFFRWTWPGPLASASLLMVMVVAAASFVVVVVPDAFFLVFRSLGEKLSDMSDLFAPPAPGASSFHHHHHLPIPANQSFRDGFEAIPCQAQPESIIPVGCPGRGSEEVKLLDVAIGT